MNCGADLFNGHQTGIGQFGKNLCKFIQQVGEQLCNCTTVQLCSAHWIHCNLFFRHHAVCYRLHYCRIKIMKLTIFVQPKTYVVSKHQYAQKSKQRRQGTSLGKILTGCPYIFISERFALSWSRVTFIHLCDFLSMALQWFYSFDPEWLLWHRAE